VKFNFWHWTSGRSRIDDRSNTAGNLKSFPVRSPSGGSRMLLPRRGSRTAMSEPDPSLTSRSDLDSCCVVPKDPSYRSVTSRMPIRRILSLTSEDHMAAKLDCRVVVKRSTKPFQHQGPCVGSSRSGHVPP
jgi:hypothetical protein